MYNTYDFYLSGRIARAMTPKRRLTMMKWTDLTAVKNDTVKRTATLKTAAGSRKEGLFLVEGVRGVKEVLTAEHFEAESCFAEASLWENHPDFIKKLEERLPDSVKAYRVNAEIMAKICDTETPQGIAMTVRRREWRFDDLLNGENPLIIVLENLQDPGNAGTILRTADSAGAAGVVCTKGTVDFFSPKVVRSTVGSLLHLPVVQGLETEEIQALLKEHRVKSFAAELGAAKYHFDADFCGATALWIGNEGAGLTEEAKNGADEKIKIPMPGKAESLNAAMAAGILMYEAVRQRMRG